MFRDVRTVIWKETKEILGQRGRFKGSKAGMLIFLAVFGIVLPLQNGPEWVRSPLVMIYWAWVPFLLARGVVADAFAGERERHTLETLLATRLPDRAILLGKILAITVYGWGLILASQVVATVALTLVHGHGRLLFFAPGVLAAVATIGLLLPLLLTTIGVSLSMNAPTARAAGQRMLVPFLAIYGLPALLPFVGRQLHLSPPAAWLAPGNVVAVTALFCAAATGVAMAVALRSFRRERLVLA